MPLQYTLLGFSYYYTPPRPHAPSKFFLSPFFSRTWNCIFVLDITALENNNYTSSINILPQYLQYLLQFKAVMDIAAP